MGKGGAILILLYPPILVPLVMVGILVILYLSARSLYRRRQKRRTYKQFVQLVEDFRARQQCDIEAAPEVREFRPAESAVTGWKYVGLDVLLFGVADVQQIHSRVVAYQTPQKKLARRNPRRSHAYPHQDHESCHESDPCCLKRPVTPRVPDHPPGSLKPKFRTPLPLCIILSASA